MSTNEKTALNFNKFTAKQNKESVLKIIEDNPFLYGGDFGNPLIMQRYVHDVHNILLPIETFIACSTVLRERNHILKERIDLDFRDHNSIKRDNQEMEATKPFPELI
jgi:hypothetical protein